MKLTTQIFFTFLVLGIALGVGDIDDQEEEDYLSSPKQILHPPNTLEHASIFLICKVREHVFTHVISLNKNLSTH
jgi:hypothetical protein